MAGVITRDYFKQLVKEHWDADYVYSDLKRQGYTIEGDEDAVEEVAKRNAEFEQDKSNPDGEYNSWKSTFWAWLGAAGAALAPAVWLWWLYGAWKVVKEVGKKVYWLTLPPTQAEAEAIQSYDAGTSDYKPRTAVDTALDQPIIQKWGRTISSKVGQMWTRGGIWVQSEAQASNLWKWQVKPMLQQSQKTVNIQSLIDEMKPEVIKMAKEDPDKLKELKVAWTKLRKAFSSEKYQALNMESTQNLKSGLQQRTPVKFFKWKEITNAYRELRGKLSSKLVKTLHSNLAEEFGVDSAQMYQDYANLKWLSKIWPNALTQSWRKQGFWGFVSWAVDTLWTPISTTAGKLMYKWWEAMMALPKAVYSKLQKWLKSAPDAIKNGVKKGIKSGNIAWALVQLAITPWMPWEYAAKAFETYINYNAKPENFIKLKWWPFKAVSKDDYERFKEQDWRIMFPDGSLYDKNWLYIGKWM